jgi:hypothetical protein
MLLLKRDPMTSDVQYQWCKGDEKEDAVLKRVPEQYIASPETIRESLKFKNWKKNNADVLYGMIRFVQDQVEMCFKNDGRFFLKEKDLARELTMFAYRNSSSSMTNSHKPV